MDRDSWRCFVHVQKNKERVKEVEKKNDEAWIIAKKKVEEHEAIAAGRV